MAHERHNIQRSAGYFDLAAMTPEFTPFTGAKKFGSAVRSALNELRRTSVKKAANGPSARYLAGEGELTGTSGQNILRIGVEAGLALFAINDSIHGRSKRAAVLGGAAAYLVLEDLTPPIEPQSKSPNHNPETPTSYKFFGVISAIAHRASRIGTPLPEPRTKPVRDIDAMKAFMNGYDEPDSERRLLGDI